MSDPSTPADRRAAARMQPTFGTVCRLPAGGDFGLVWDLSETGVGLLVPAPLPVGAVVPAELAAEAGGPGLPVTLIVAHSRPVRTGDHFLGARFDRRLTADQLKPFVTPPPPPAKV